MLIVTDWDREVRELIAARRPRDAFAVLERAAEEHSEAARELGHLLLQVDWLGGVGGVESEAELWLRRAVSARPEDVQAMTLLATLLAVQCRRDRDTPWESDPEHAYAVVEQWAAEACILYNSVLRLDPGSGAAASGLALLLSDERVPGEGVPSPAEIAQRALGINPDEPVAMLVLADQTGDHRLRERAEALSPPIPTARWRPALAGGPVSPFGQGERARFDYFVLEAAVEVTNQGETAPGFAVLRDLEQVKRFDVYSSVADAVAYRYERGIPVAKHTAGKLSGKSLGQAAEEWQAERDPSVCGQALPIGHPVRHDGKTLHYGVNGILWELADF